MKNKIEYIDFNDIFKVIKRLFLFNGIFLIFMSLFRLIFFFYFSKGQHFLGMYNYVAEAFFLGMRFDLSIIAYINTIVILSLLIFWALKRKKWFVLWKKVLPYYYWIMYSIVLFILVVDFGFYSYFKDHINVTIYGFFEDDTFALIKTIIQDSRFPFAFSGVTILFILNYYLCRRFTFWDESSKTRFISLSIPVWMKTLFIFLLVSLNALAARGSLKMFPLSPIYSEISNNAFINKLSLNGLFALGEAIKARSKNNTGNFNVSLKMGYNSSEKKAFSNFLDLNENLLDDKNFEQVLIKKTQKNKIIEKLRPNVVVIIMESFGSNLLRYDSKEFDLLGKFRKHYESGYVFHNFLPAGLITIHAIESMVLNIYQLPFNLSVTQTKYAYNQYPSASGHVYKNAGYKTIFAYGGSLRWRQLDTFLPNQGFDELIGEGSFVNAKSNQWGVYDEYLFDSVYSKLANNNTQPQFIMVMTTTNHPPYSVPETYVPSSLKIPENLKKIMIGDKDLINKRCITYQYANQMLGDFISRIKNSDLGKNTIIAVTGDHNFWDIFNYDKSEQFYRYSVPFYLYIPNSIRPSLIDTSVFACHADIMPTLYNLSLSDKEYISMGKNILDKKLQHNAINGEGITANSQGVMIYQNNTDNAEFYDWNKNKYGELITVKNSSKTADNKSYYKAAMAVSEYIIKNSGK